MGGGMTDKQANKYLSDLKEDIDKLEYKLSIKLNREKKLERILKDEL
jgi:hypothetical protein